MPDNTSRAPPVARAVHAGPLTGRLRVPGDKSISHRAFLVPALAVGESRATGCLESDDVQATRACLQALGVDIQSDGPGSYRIHGVGTYGFAPPDGVLDCGNSGTAARLLAGALAGHAFPAVLTGDASLRRRPMRRVTAPLAAMGAEFVTAEGGCLPVTITGTHDLVPLEWTSEVASAQVKTCVLFAGLHASGTTTVAEPRQSRDHGERMLRQFGAVVTAGRTQAGHHAVSVEGNPGLHPAQVTVPGDISSAAFPMVAALLNEGSDVELEGVGVNPTRTGIVDVLNAMGAGIEVEPIAGGGEEPAANIRVRGRGRLRAIDLGPDWAPRTIDEYPALAVAAACADGVSRFRGLDELRVKESNRLEGLRAGLVAAGVAARIEEDDLLIEGASKPPGGARIDAALDHRIAMAFLVFGTAAAEPVEVTGAETIRTSWPGFGAAMQNLGAGIATPPPPS